MSNPDITLVPIDPADGDLVRSWIDQQTAAVRRDLAGFPEPNPAASRLRLLSAPASMKIERWAAVADGDVAGHITLHMFEKDNRHMAECDLEVRPDRRRDGVGTRLLQFLEERVKRNGRDTVIAYAVDEIFGRPGAETPGKHFAAKHGYAVGDTEICRRNDLTGVDEGELTERYAAAWKWAEGYELVEWTDRVPDDVAEGVARMEARMWTDPPIGELDIRPAVYDVDRIRDDERVRREHGALEIAAAVRHAASGQVAGYTSIRVDPGDEDSVWQGDTIVDPGHRGRRLGTVLKIANQRRLRRHRPMVRYVITWNAEVNSHMIDINEAIGYRPFFRELAVQKKLA
ncbi:GNAT family N-acetyltransferase [Glycomyces xiaoerkulensis]|uniref:GNAT family N-acetyltransferase n=1 Tax=Glycomyces xiaoerkulensis TaxID=2038139 RepID=UPI0018E41621|nr:GNAT family N-acetyltransferase [Glycomyces xiaoerkulensis]